MAAPIRTGTALVCLAALSACQAGGGVVERLDSSSGLTIVTEAQPVVFARTEGRYSRSARDYLYIGPVEVNERGSREYFLWVGIASTLDRGYLTLGGVNAPDFLFASVRGELMQFELKPWNERLPELAGARIYAPTVAPQQALAARVTLDQLELLANEQLDSVRIGQKDSRSLDYYLWKDEWRWGAFLGRAAGATASTER